MMTPSSSRSPSLDDDVPIPSAAPYDDDLTPTLLSAWRRLLVNRSQPYAVQQQDGSYRWVDAPCTLDVLAAHLRGEMTLALASADAQGVCKWVCLDADLPDTLPQLVALRAVFAKLGLPGALEASRRGGHLWLFFSAPLAAREAMLAIVQALAMARPRLEDAGITLAPLEVYPSTGAAGLGGTIAHAMRLPLGVHQLMGERYPLLSATGKPVERATVGLAARWLLRQPRIRLQAVEALSQKRVQTLAALPPHHARLTSPASLWVDAVSAAPPALTATLAVGDAATALVGTHSPVIRWVDAQVSLLDLLANLAPDSEMCAAGRVIWVGVPFTMTAPQMSGGVQVALPSMSSSIGAMAGPGAACPPIASNRLARCGTPSACTSCSLRPRPQRRSRQPLSDGRSRRRRRDPRNPLQPRQNMR